MTCTHWKIKDDKTRVNDVKNRASKARMVNRNSSNMFAQFYWIGWGGGFIGAVSWDLWLLLK